MSNLIPVNMTGADLGELLNDIATGFAEGDTLEGNIEFLMHIDPSEGREKHLTWDVRGSYRYGNRDHGQGFMRLIGEVPRDPVGFTPEQILREVKSHDGLR